eukprot:CAMPEP_0196201762 /NCGR_PEP_ID=MMETSP0912-20130531/4761_1 /TAXON_ID=49265 /ORGANISM="Thalassiosira rotula, Strain GSO102" /LENGTH=253 /DNA_ID=CAMNT_0041475513 /DNA_START=250 /DNA_END=1007 /DNA_ORIENTATION=+
MASSCNTAPTAYERHRYVSLSSLPSERSPGDTRGVVCFLVLFMSNEALFKRSFLADFAFCILLFLLALLFPCFVFPLLVVGLPVPSASATVVGVIVGGFDGGAVGAFVGDLDGVPVGAFVGVFEGDAVGAMVGGVDGAAVGDVEGAFEGAVVGADVITGCFDGAAVGAVVGAADGAAVGTKVASRGHVPGRDASVPLAHSLFVVQQSLIPEVMEPTVPASKQALEALHAFSMPLMYPPSYAARVHAFSAVQES